MPSTYFFTIYDFLQKHFFWKFSTSFLVSVNEACSHEQVFTWYVMHLAANFMILSFYLETFYWDILLHLKQAWL